MSNSIVAIGFGRAGDWNEARAAVEAVCNSVRMALAMSRTLAADSASFAPNHPCTASAPSSRAPAAIPTASCQSGAMAMIGVLSTGGIFVAIFMSAWTCAALAPITSWSRRNDSHALAGIHSGSTPRFSAKYTPIACSDPASTSV